MESQDSHAPIKGTKRNYDGSIIGHDARSNTATHEVIQWGYQIKSHHTSLRYLKLLLDPHQDLPSYVSREDLYSQLQLCGKTAAEAIADYLSALYKRIQEELVKRYGKVMVDTTMIEYVVTVPAVWSDVAKDETLKAAEQAGIGPNLHMISEPEAAAIYTLKALDLEASSVGQDYIIVDAGGGTVDIISYEIQSLSPLRLKESVRGTGELCGGAFLNIRFQELIKSRISTDTFKELVTQKPKAWDLALKYFEDYVKRMFDPSDDKDAYDDTKFSVPLPGVADNAAAGLEGGFILITNAEVAEIFRPIVSRIIELTEGQRAQLVKIGRTPKGIILVGGFGQSNYLFKSFKSHFADNDPTVKTEAQRLVIQPNNAWTAVVRGAVLSGLEGDRLITSRKARYDYGVRCCDKYDEAIHSVENKFWSEYWERY